jgi:uncharacterized protein
MGTDTKTSSRSQIKRLAKRGDYSLETLHSILDEGFVCHVGFVVDGQPFVIPTGYGRQGDMLYLHGSSLSRMLHALAEGIDVCVTVTHLDGLVMARSAFHHSMNYRSAVIFGKARLIAAREQKLLALRAISDQIAPGRWEEVRQPKENELKATLVVGLQIQEASSKVRSGPPIDDEDDYALDVWAGVLPMSLKTDKPVDDPRLKPGIKPPDYLTHYKRPSSQI